MAAAWVSAIAAAIASLNGVLGWRHRKYDDQRFKEVHERISNGS